MVYKYKFTHNTKKHIYFLKALVHSPLEFTFWVIRASL